MDLYVFLGVFGFFILLIFIFLIYLFTYKFKYRLKSSKPIKDKVILEKHTIKENEEDFDKVKKHLSFSPKFCLKVISTLSLFLTASSISLFLYSFIYLHSVLLIISIVSFPIFTTLFYLTK